MTFGEKLKSLGHASYAAYLASPHWVEFRARWRQKNRGKCRVCGNRRYQLHHRTYSHLGNERFSDVVPLCDLHHDQVHEVLRAESLPVGKTKKAISIINARMRPVHDAERHAALKAKAAADLAAYRAKRNRRT